MDAAHTLLAFFETRRGRMQGFRFRDPVDNRSWPPSGEISTLDQGIGTGDGETTAFQLVKRYASGGASVERVVSKPVEETVVVAVDGIATSTFGVDWMTGAVTLESAPAEGAVVTAGFSVGWISPTGCAVWSWSGASDANRRLAATPGREATCTSRSLAYLGRPAI